MTASPTLSKITPAAFFEPGSPVVAVDSSGSAYLAWTEVAPDASAQTYVYKWDGGPAWSQIGGALSHPKLTPAGLAMSVNNGHVFVAHGDKDASAVKFEAVVDEWNGSAWVRSTSALGFSGGVDLISYGNRDLLFAWNQGDTAPQLNVWRRTSGFWSIEGSAGRARTPLANPSLAVDTSPTPRAFVAWDQAVLDTAGTVIGYFPYVRSLPTTDLDDSPAGTTSNQGPTTPSLAWWNAAPVVAWTRSPVATPTVEVDRWSGTAWVPMGAPIAAAPAARQHQLIQASGTQSTLALASVVDPGFGHAAVFEWDATALAWSKVCSNLVDPANPAQMATGVTGVAVAQDSQGTYVVGVVQVVSGKLFVERVSH